MTKYVLALFALFYGAACGDDFVPAGPAPETGPSAVIVSGNFNPGEPGVMSRLSLETLTMHRRIAPSGAIGDDPMMRKFGDELFVVNRNDGNNVTILDATTHSLVEQLGTGAGSNPQDVAVKGNKLYVPVYGGAGVAVLTRGSQTISTIDLSSLDPDGQPNCMSAYTVGSDIYVACQMLDENFAPRGPGKVVVIDTANDQVKTTVTMMTKNPLALFEQLPGGDLAIASIDFSDNSGCVERITTTGTPASAGCIVTNTTLTGYANAFDTHASTLYVAVASPTDFTKSQLWAYDMTANALGSAPMSATAEKIIDVAACPDGTIVASDGASASGGVRLYRNGSEVTTDPLVVGLTPAAQHGLACY